MNKQPKYVSQLFHLELEASFHVLRAVCPVVRPRHKLCEWRRLQDSPRPFGCAVWQRIAGRVGALRVVSTSAGDGCAVTAGWQPVLTQLRLSWASRECQLKSRSGCWCFWGKMLLFNQPVQSCPGERLLLASLNLNNCALFFEWEISLAQKIKCEQIQSTYNYQHLLKLRFVQLEMQLWSVSQHWNTFAKLLFNFLRSKKTPQVTGLDWSRSLILLCLLTVRGW